MTGGCSFSSARLAFRPLMPGDVSETYVNWLNDPMVNRFLETRHEKQTLESCASFVLQTSKDPASYFFGVFEKGSGRHVGNAKIGFVHNLYRHGQVSLFIGDRASWGRGYGTEIVGALTRYGFEDAGLEKLEAGCYEQNFASLRAFLSNGYVVEGFLRGHGVVEGQRQGVFRLGILKHDAAAFRL